jgi:hypothetical protein
MLNRIVNLLLYYWYSLCTGTLVVILTNHITQKDHDDELHRIHVVRINYAKAPSPRQHRSNV